MRVWMIVLFWILSQWKVSFAEADAGALRQRRIVEETLRLEPAELESKLLAAENAAKMAAANSVK